MIANCGTCALQTGSTNAYCVNCLAGYFVSGLSCSACTVISNCLTCSGASTCTQCAAGYNLILGACSNQACANTTTNCHVCSTTNNAVCITCEPGYSLASGVCSPITCSNGFVFDSTTNQCGCSSGTYLSGTTCQPCSDGNCLTCSLSVCSSCVDGYYPFGSACIACIANCKTCSNGISCSQCSQGYSLTPQGTCMYYGQGGDSATTNSNGVVLRCEAGCQVCVASSVNALSTICTMPMQGYSIVSGAIRKCPSLCLSCDGASATLCTSCYPGYALISGSCSQCTDPNALTCSPLNTTYSLTCVNGYTSAYFTNTTAGVCSACAPYCRRCDSTGPGNCDSNSCSSGAVQVSGTTTCTLCFGQCVTCSAYNPNTCISCGLRRYLSTSNTCVLCQTGCRTCTTSSTNCQSCDAGYNLVSSSCILVPANCVAVDASGTCTSCFVGYILSGGVCGADISCNTNVAINCNVCPNGYYLQANQCTICPTISNCKSCDTNNNTLCLVCNTGYYVNDQSLCQQCPLNCQACDTNLFCTQAASGYYISLDYSGGYSGKVVQCNSPCATCRDYADSCNSCIVGYTLKGTFCAKDTYLAINMVMNQGTDPAQTIILSTDTASQQLFKGIKAIDTIGNMLYGIAPTGMKAGTTTYKEGFFFQSVTVGSLNTLIHGNTGTYTDGTAAANDMTAALQSAPTASASIVSHSVTSVGLPTTTTSTS